MNSAITVERWLLPFIQYRGRELWATSSSQGFVQLVLVNIEASYGSEENHAVFEASRTTDPTGPSFQMKQK